MPIIISVGSGKGGVGKSILSTNIAYLLAKSGRSVTLIDMDLGGADIHVLMGLFKPKYTLTDFIENKVDTLDEIAERLNGFARVRIISGTGDSLHTANMPVATRAKLIRHVKLIKSDIVIIDVGAGTHVNTLDFFNAANIHLCVTTGDPTAILDLYRFIKLAVIRRALSSFLAHDIVSKIIRRKDIKNIEELLAIAAEYGEDKKQAINNSINQFYPCIIFNQVNQMPNTQFSRFQSLLQTYLKISKPALLGKIPEDQELRKSVKVYHPVSSLAPNAPSAKALKSICDNLLEHIHQFQLGQA